MKDILPIPQTVPLQNHLLVRTSSLDELIDRIYPRIDPRKTRFIDPGCPTEMSVTRFKLKHSQFYGVSHQAPIQTQSTPLSTLQINIPIRGMLKAYGPQGEACVNPGEAIVYLPGDTLKLDWAANTSVLVMIIEPTIFENYLNKTFDSQFYQMKLNSPILKLTEGPGLGFANTISLLLAEAENPHSLLIGNVLSDSFEELLFGSIGNLFVSQQSLASIRYSSPGIPGYVKRAVDYIMEYTEQDISISDLVAVSNVSMRSLQSGFAKQFNTGPMTFLKQARLQRARDELLSANPEETHIIDVATKWGFYHQSNFAKIYHNYFGELPTDTLRKISWDE